MLNQITPVLLTYNEAINIGRTLSRLTWAKDIVVVDTGSTDGTLEILARTPYVRVFSRKFETHATQWRYATEETIIQTPWILRLDADYQVTDELRDEISNLNPNAYVNAYRISFDFAVFGHRLISSLYPANTILLRQGTFSICDDGHTERWDSIGPIKALKSRVIHDDWKTTERWLVNQVNYSKRNYFKIAMKSELPRSKLSSLILDQFRRRPPLMPFVSFFYCLFIKGLILNGRAGLYYALQRLVAESSLSLWVLEQQLHGNAESLDARERNQDKPPTY